MPEPVATNLMLNNGERAFYSVATTWAQVTLPIGSFGVNPLATGVLCVTSERLLFSGHPKNATISLKKIVDCHCYSDFLKVDKTTGKSDLFTMTAGDARYVIALIRALKHQGKARVALVERKDEKDTYVTRVRLEAATEKQKEKLRYFGCTFDKGITKGQASDAIDECVRLYPEKDIEYYNRPATEEQREKLRSFGEDPDEDLDESGEPLSYGQAKDWIWECEIDQRAKDEKRFSDECDKLSKQRHEPGGDLY